MNGLKKCCAAVAAICILSGAQAADNAKTVNFVTDSEKSGGFLIEVTKAAFEKVGYRINVQFLPWARALHNTTAGQAEALLGVYYSPERAQTLQYSDSIGVSELVFFKLASTPIAYSKLQDLRPYVIGTIIGAAYPAEFEAAHYLKKAPETNFQTNLKKLLAGRIALMLEKRRVIQNALTTEYPQWKEQVVALEPPLASRKFYNAFSKKMPGYQQKVADFNKGLALIARDGTLRKIMSRHLHE
jgi:polar amino acid transport system substrate-binding protein